MESGKALLDKATRLVGSRYRIAEMLGMDESFLSRIAHGKANMPPELAARVADLIGEDTREAACVAMVEKEKDKRRRAELAELFRVRLVQEAETVAANDTGNELAMREVSRASAQWRKR